MKCDKAFDQYLSLDKNEHVPLSLTLHLLYCPVCRTGVRHLTHAEETMSSILEPVPAQRSADPVVAAALARIAAAGLVYPSVPVAVQSVSLFRWLVAGFVLILGFAVVPSSSIGIWSSETFGVSFLVPFYLLGGVLVTVYCGLFVGTNIDLFVKKFGFRHIV